MNEAHLNFFSQTQSRADAIAAGFRFGQIGTHTSRTIMLDELATVFAAVPTDAKLGVYVDAIVDGIRAPAYLR